MSLTTVLLGALAIGLFEVFLRVLRPRVQFTTSSGPGLLFACGPQDPGSTWGAILMLHPKLPQGPLRPGWSDNGDHTTTCLGFTWAPMLTLIVEIPWGPAALGLTVPTEDRGFPNEDHHDQ